MMETRTTLDIARCAGGPGARLKRYMDNNQTTSIFCKRMSVRDTSDGVAGCSTTIASTHISHPSSPSSPASTWNDELAPNISELSGLNQFGLRQFPQHAPDRAKASLSRDSVFRAKTGFRHLPTQCAPKPVEFITPTNGLLAANSCWPAGQPPPAGDVAKKPAAGVRAAVPYTGRLSLVDQPQLLSRLRGPTSARPFAVAASRNNFRDVFGVNLSCSAGAGVVTHNAAGSTAVHAGSRQQESDGAQSSNSGGSVAALAGTGGAQITTHLGSANDGVETDLDWGWPQAVAQRRPSAASCAASAAHAVERSSETSSPCGTSNCHCDVPHAVTDMYDAQLRIVYQAVAAVGAMPLDSRIRVTSDAGFVDGGEPGVATAAMEGQPTTSEDAEEDARLATTAIFPRTRNRSISSITNTSRATCTVFGSSAAAPTTPGADTVTHRHTQGGAEALPSSPRPWQPALTAQLDAGSAVKLNLAGTSNITGGGSHAAAYDGAGGCGQVATVDMRMKSSSGVLIFGGVSTSPAEIDKGPSADAYLKTSSGSCLAVSATALVAPEQMELDLDLPDEVFDQVFNGLDDKMLEDLGPDIPENLSDMSVLDGDPILLGGELEALLPRVGDPEISPLDGALIHAMFPWW